MSSLSRKLLTGFSLLGLGASSAATYVHYNLIRTPDYSSFCDINATVSCKAAYLSRYGSIGGVPVAVGGIIFFAWVLLMLWGSQGKSRIKDSAPAYIFAGSTLALAFTLYLAYASFFILGEVCPLCVATYVAVIGVFIISGGASSVPMSSLPKRIMTDMRLLVATPVALVIALLFVAGTAWGVAAFPSEAPAGTAPAVLQLPPLTQQQRTEFEQWWDLQQASPNFPIPRGGEKVQIVEFADFQCPHCKQMYYSYKPILDKYLAQYPKDVAFVFKNWPLSSGCNAAVSGVHFSASCETSAAYLMAKQKGTGDALKDWMFLNQEKLSPATVKSAVADVGKVTDFDAQYSKTLMQVRTDAAIGTSLGINSTPTFFINGKRIPSGGVPPQFFDLLIELELKKSK